MTAVCFLLFLSAIAFCVISGRSLLWGLCLGFSLFFLLGLKRGHTPRSLLAMAWRRGKQSLLVAPVLLLIGIVAALWRSSGTISFFLYHGLREIPPSLFILTAFLLCTLLSFALGTCFGVSGTAGVVLMILARSGGVDPVITAGAILSGAFFGDRCSPMSSCATLVAAATGTQLYDNVREMLKTVVLPLLLTTAFYAFFSVRNPISHVDDKILTLLSEQFSLHWIVLLPAVLVLILPLFHINVKWALTASAVASFLISVFVQGNSVPFVLRTALLGYSPAHPEVARILSGSGLTSMLVTASLVFVTSHYASLLEGLDILAPAKHIIEKAADRIGLFPTTALASMVIGTIFCNQAIVVLMISQLLPEVYQKHGHSPTVLAMDLSNSGVVMVGMIPWAIAVSVPLSMIGAGPESIPYAALLYTIPLCYLFTRRFFLPAQNRLHSAERNSPL